MNELRQSKQVVEENGIRDELEVKKGTVGFSFYFFLDHIAETTQNKTGLSRPQILKKCATALRRSCHVQKRYYIKLIVSI